MRQLSQMLEGAKAWHLFALNAHPDIPLAGAPLGDTHDSETRITIRLDATAKAASTLGQAKDELQAMARMVEGEIVSVAKAFEGFAGDTDTILSLAAAIVGCVENESVSSILPKVQSLGAAARRFMSEKLEATTGVLDTVTNEVKLLGQLSAVAGSQEAIALEIKALSVLTNIEVAHLGSVGECFQYLARELADFSKSVIDDTAKLASHTTERRAAIEDTRRVLSAELPRLREDLARIEVDLGNALATVEAGLTQLSTAPVQFRTCVEDIAKQITAVVAAVQAHDITRQQIEHVQDGFTLIAESLRGQSDDGSPGHRAAPELPRAYAGLTIQIYQLKTIKETVASWASQIRTCMGGILKVSASDVVGIGPLVLEQEKKVSLQLVRIRQLEREGQAYSEKIQHTLAGLSNLMQLVRDHLQHSKSIRDRLRLLAFNSIVEANHLGTKADVILAISTRIKGISTTWGLITDQSDSAMQEILNLVKQTNHVMEAFSEASNDRLHEAEVDTVSGLDNLRGAAEFAARQAREMKSATEKMHAKIAKVGRAGDLLDSCSGRFDAVLTEIEGVKRELEIGYPKVANGYNAAEMEQLFSASYTTEREREVLRAALNGTALPVGQQSFAGNSVELF